RLEYFSFLAVAVVTVFLMCAGSTQGEDQFTVAARQMMRIYADPHVSREVQQRNLDHLATFYQRNRRRIQFTPQERRQADNLLQRYNQAKATTVMVDGVPRQGGAAAAVLVPIAVDAAKELFKWGMSHLRSSASGVEINRWTAILGLAFIMACYLFRSKSL
ncbi:hypothetical protein KR054_004571, partial [Drosophila jambulina]